MKRRRPQTLYEASQELRDAWAQLGRALLASPPGRCLERLVEWLYRRLANLRSGR